MPRGGKRTGSGRKKGPVKLEKEAAREIVRRLVFKQLKPLIAAQISNALGIRYLVVREKKTGKFVRVTEAMARQKQAIEDTEEIIEVWEKDPSVQAYSDLLNRSIDKPAEQIQKIELSGEINIVDRLRAARERLARRDK